MSLPAVLQGRLSIPVIGSPLFIISNPDLVIAQCKAGIVGSFPSLNARPLPQFEEWLQQLTAELGPNDAPYAVNLIVHRSNDRLMDDLALCVKYKVPIIITSLGAREDVNEAIHSYGGIVFHDVINDKFSRKAIDKGADGLIAVAAGAGGHAGTLSPFAMIQEIRQWFDGPVALSGAIATGDAVLAAQAMGADLGYIGSAFIATTEARADQRYKEMIVASRANYLKPSIIAAGMNPDALPESDASAMNFGGGGDSAKTKAWKDIWGCGQGIGAVTGIVPAAELVARLKREYDAALSRLLGGSPALRAAAQ